MWLLCSFPSFHFLWNKLIHIFFFFSVTLCNFEQVYYVVYYILNAKHLALFDSSNSVMSLYHCLYIHQIGKKKDEILGLWLISKKNEHNCYKSCHKWQFTIRIFLLVMLLYISCMYACIYVFCVVYVCLF